MARHKAFWAYLDDSEDAYALVVVDCYWDAFVLSAPDALNGLTSCPTCETLVSVSTR